MTVPQLIPPAVLQEADALASNSVELLPRAEFASKLARARAESRPLRIKYGADPSAPDIHLGHSVPIRKLRQFQDAGHQVVFIIGGYTARIGDPSGKNSARPRLTKEEVAANAQTYLDQIFRILDRERTEVVDNSDWLESMDVSATIELMSKYTVSQMLEREDFHKRFESETPIFIHEFIYPLLQGYDSIAVRADLELGGTDQKFNLLVGRELMRIQGMEPQCIMTMPLLVGLDGQNKMSKSLGNYIGISDDATAMFGKAMSLPDELMENWFALTLGRTDADIGAIRQELASGTVTPRDMKERLAAGLVELYHSTEAARAAADDFRARFTLGEFPDATAERLTLAAGAPQTLLSLLSEAKAAPSKRDIRRLLEQRAVRFFESPLTPEQTAAFEANAPDFAARETLPAGTYKLKIGKKRFVRAEIA